LRCGEPRAVDVGERGLAARRRPAIPRATARRADACRRRDLERGVGKRIDRVLRQQADAQRALARRPFADARPLEADGDRGGRAQSRERGKQRRLADAVRADDDPALARAHGEREPLHSVRPALASVTFSTRASRDRRSRKRKIGTPASAVSTPTGSCAGATTERASVSATTSKRPPASADAGRRIALVVADDEAHACGHDEADEADAARDRDGDGGRRRGEHVQRERTTRTLTPSVAAVASPRASSVASRAKSSATASTRPARAARARRAPTPTGRR
jgi:hypothetical protein